MRLSRHLLPLVGLCCLTAVAVTPAPAEAQSKSRVKAAMVYNIMRFVNYPTNQGSLRLCGLQSDPTAADLRTLDGRSVGDARVDVVLVGSPSDIGASCDVVYLDNAAPRSVGGTNRGQVLIGGGRSFAESGGTVGLINFGGQIRFVINDSAAKRSNVSFRAQLLQLAARVIR